MLKREQKQISCNGEVRKIPIEQLEGAHYHEVDAGLSQVTIPRKKNELKRVMTHGLSP